MENAYRAFEGVLEITAAAKHLQDARDALDTIGALDLLTRHGVDVGDLVIVHGRLVRSRPSARALDGETASVSAADWFS